MVLETVDFIDFPVLILYSIDRGTAQLDERNDLSMDRPYWLSTITCLLLTHAEINYEMLLQ